MENIVLPVRKQYETRDRWLIQRLDQKLPDIMKRSGIDMWVVMTDENNEDPVTKTLLPSRLINASAKMILVFYLKNGQVVRESVSRPCGVEDIYINSWYGITDTDWKGKLVKKPDTTALEYLRFIVGRENPARIGVDTDAVHYFCDGISHTNYMALTEALGEYAARLVPARELSVSWMECHCGEELDAFAQIVKTAHDIISKSYDKSMITPGITANDDIRFDMMQRASDMGMDFWFDCSCAVFRKNYPGMHNDTHIIQPGDVVHCDLGIEYLGLCTDAQELCYILRDGETDAPEGLKHALKVTNRLQDIVLSNIKLGRTGNDVFTISKKQASSEGIDAMIYSHPLGVYGHAPGPVVGTFSNQNPSEMGECVFHDGTVHALELNAKVPIPEWGGETLMCCLETEIMLQNGEAAYLSGRQTEFHLV